MKQFDFDFVVVGSGLAGLIAAFHASCRGTVALISKSELDISNSYNAQGGIAAAIGTDDDPLYHLEDTLTAGRGLCDYDSSYILVNEGLEQVRKMISMGVAFDKDAEGELILGLEGGHSHRRILHADGDATGKVMTGFMLRKILENPRITPFEYTTAVKIFTQNGVCAGIQTLDYNTGENAIFRTKATILATGGLSRIYSRSTNPYTATGDGISLAWHAGARLADMEFIQFHPTALAVDGEEAYLISEAVRGEGAYLLDKYGDRFMLKLHQMAELAPRDVVASAIFKRMQETGSTVFLSLRHLDSAFLKERFHSIDAKLKSVGIDLTSDLIPIAPAAHYTVGGIRTDLWGQTNVTGLFACGEVASTGVMGANRLASNSLLECLVFGRRLIEKAKDLPTPTGNILSAKDVTLNLETSDVYLQIKNELSELMSNKVGIVRNEQEMTDSLRRIEEILTQYPSDQQDYNIKKINDLATVCRLICVSAIERKESRGGHVRSDYPGESDELVHHIIQEKGKKISTEKVRKKNFQ
ncbi:MAG TPA: L-aspartate oxidase [Prolixibacteraceae bacterium]